MEALFENFQHLELNLVIMWLIGGFLIFCAIKWKMEPTLLLPMGFGTILVNLPNSGAIGEEGVLTVLTKAGIDNELFPLLLFIGIGAMIDFGPLLSNPKLMLFGAAAQFGIFFTLSAASFFNFAPVDAASIAIIGAADGPTSIFVANELGSQFVGAITVAAYLYMALVPMVQPPVIKLLTTKFVYFWNQSRSFYGLASYYGTWNAGHLHCYRHHRIDRSNLEFYYSAS